MTSTTPPSPERLDVNNYATWRPLMKYYLITKGAWEAVTGESSDPKLIQKALALIGLHVKEHHLPLLERCDSAKSAWEQLEALFQSKSNARKLQLRKELAQLKMGPGEPLTKYTARAKEIQDQLRAAGHTVTDQEVAWAVLAGLPTAYDMVVTVLETTNEDMTLDKIQPKLLQVERHQLQKMEPAITEEAALTAQRTQRKFARNNGNGLQRETRTCFVCGERGHIARDCPQGTGHRRSGGQQRAYGAVAL